jgi:pimeloyl-ACP methyl ester carboxylesterase
MIQVGEHGIRILERGAGPAVLLVAGTGGSVANWPATVLERLAMDHHVIALDLYGMGFSERDGDFTYGFALWSQQLVSVLDALGIERASVVGHSLGGTVVIFFAANYPDRVDRVVLAGSAISIPWWFPVLMVPGPGELFLASQEVFGPTFSADHRAQAMAAYRIRGTRVALLRYVRHSLLEARALAPAVAAVRAKVLQLHGTVDEEVPFAAAERLQSQLRDSRLVPIEGAGHYLMLDAPERFASEIEAFLPTM